MKKQLIAAAVLIGFGAASAGAEAKPGGCLKYGVGGAVAGKLAGGHTWKGAALGCALGIYKRRQYERSEAARRDRSYDRREADDRDRSYERGRSYERRRAPDYDDETGSIEGGFGRGGTFSRDPRF